MRFTRSLLLLGPALVAGSSVSAQAPRDSVCKTFDRSVSGLQSKSLQQLRYEALNAARSSLLASVGTHINATSQLTITSVGDSSRRDSRRSISQETSGTILGDTVLNWQTTDNGRTWTMSYRGCAAKIVDGGDPSFTVSAHLDHATATYAYLGPARQQRDTILVTITASQTAYITVLSHGEDDSLLVIYPSAVLLSPSRRELTRGDSLLAPPPGAKVRVTLEAEQTSSHPSMIVIATKSDVPLGDWHTNPSGLQQISWQDYLAWYNHIPQREKAMVELPYEIRRP